MLIHTNPITNIKHRLFRQNKNWLASITGPTGSGKSYSALKIAERIDPTFTVDRVVFTAEGFMYLLNNTKLRTGNAIVFDEAGVGMPTREWYSISNKMFSYILQTFRHQNLAVIFTMPSFDFIDNQARKLIHTYIKTVSINPNEKYVRVKWLNLSYNDRNRKYYAKYSISTIAGKMPVTKITMPSKELIKEYERKKVMYTKVLKTDVQTSIRDSKIKQEKLEKPRGSNIEEYALELSKKYVSGEKLPTIAKISNEYNVGGAIASRVQTKLRELLKNE